MTVAFDPMGAGFAYIEQLKKQEGLTTPELIRKYGKPALYRQFYPDGFSACVNQLNWALKTKNAGEIKTAVALVYC